MHSLLFKASQVKCVNLVYSKLNTKTETISKLHRRFKMELEMGGACLGVGDDVTPFSSSVLIIFALSPNRFPLLLLCVSSCSCSISENAAGSRRRCCSQPGWPASLCRMPPPARLLHPWPRRLRDPLKSPEAVQREIQLKAAQRRLGSQSEGKNSISAGSRHKPAFWCCDDHRRLQDFPGPGLSSHTAVYLQTRGTQSSTFLEPGT